MRQTQPSRLVRQLGAPGARRVLAAALVLVLAVLGLTAASLGGAPVASAASSCSSPVPAGQIRVVMVVDPGETGPRGPSATCLVVAAGTSGAKILSQRASQLGLPAPRYDPAGSGLLCGLDGFPSTGCPVATGGGYDYWAYFNGVGGSWSWGRDNPFVRRMIDGEIMGWRYAIGAADGDAPRPRIAPTGALFPPSAPAPTAPPATAPPTGGGGGTPSGGAGAPAGSTGGAPAIPDLSGLALPAGSTPSTPPDSAPVTTADTADTDLDGAATDDGIASDDDASTSGEGSSEVVEDGVEELAAEPLSGSGADTGRWVGAAVAVAVALALVIGAVVVNHGRSRARTG